MAEKLIKGIEYRYRPMLATKSLRLQVQFFKMMSPVAGEFDNVIKALRGEAPVNAAVLRAIAAVFARCNPAEVTEFAEELLTEIQIKRASGNYDQLDPDGDLSGKIELRDELLRWVFWEEYGPFFLGLASLGALARQQEEEPEQNPA